MTLAPVPDFSTPVTLRRAALDVSNLVDLAVVLDDVAAFDFGCFHLKGRELGMENREWEKLDSGGMVGLRGTALTIPYSRFPIPARFDHLGANLTAPSRRIVSPLR